VIHDTQHPGATTDRPRGLQTGLRSAAGIVAAVGAAGAVAIYVAAGNESAESPLQDLHGSKMYAHNLELYGGKMAVLEDDLSRWFNSIWHGRRLAFTVACISATVSWALAFAARRVQHHHEPDEQS
jgi:ABC-type Fe3+ transport system permease subunit